MSTVLIIVISVLALFCIWLFWEAYHAPIMPDDYGVTNEDKKLWKRILKKNAKNRKNEKNK